MQLTQSLEQGSVFESKKLIVEIAKHHNKMGGVDAYMREFARVLLKANHGLARQLEIVMNSEVAI